MDSARRCVGGGLRATDQIKPSPHEKRGKIYLEDLNGTVRTGAAKHATRSSKLGETANAEEQTSAGMHRAAG